jgi:curved DNA-binding protein CbpA
LSTSERSETGSATHLTRSFREARRVLGVGSDDDAAAIKRAYRRAAASSPPDRDPEGFRRIRDAYELLSDPFERASALLYSPVPLTPAPSLPPSPVPPQPTALATELLRSILGTRARADLAAPAAPARATPTPSRASGEPPSMARTPSSPSPRPELNGNDRSPTDG